MHASKGCATARTIAQAIRLKPRGAREAVSVNASVNTGSRATVWIRPAALMVRKTSAKIAMIAKAPMSARVSRRAKRTKMTKEKNWRSEEHTSELQSLMRISYAVFCLKKKNK